MAVSWLGGGGKIRVSGLLWGGSGVGYGFGKLRAKGNVPICWGFGPGMPRDLGKMLHIQRYYVDFGLGIEVRE